MANAPGGYTRILTGDILADNGDGTFIVDIDGDGVGVSVVRAPVVQVGQPGTVLDLDGAQVLIGPRATDDQPNDALRGIGSFEQWNASTATVGGQIPDGWNTFWSSGPGGTHDVTPDAVWQTDGALSAKLGVTAVASRHIDLINTTVLLAPAAGHNLRVTGTYKPEAAQAGNKAEIQVIWGTTDAMANPLAAGAKVSTPVSTVLTAATDAVPFDVTLPMPVGAYVYARIQLRLIGMGAGPVAGKLSYDGVRTEWLAPGSADAAWVPWTPQLIAATTNPNIGTTGASATGRYTRNGTTVTGWGSIDAGTAGVNVGSGVYGFTLPITPQADSVIAVPFIIGVSTTDIRHGVGRQTTGAANVNRLYVADSSAYNTGISMTVAHVRLPVNNSGSWFLRFSFSYEAALPAPV